MLSREIINGLTIIHSDRHLKTVYIWRKKPRSKKQRILKKWRKKYSYEYSKPMEPLHFLQTGTIVMHTRDYLRLKAAMNGQERTKYRQKYERTFSMPTSRLKKELLETKIEIPKFEPQRAWCGFDPARMQDDAALAFAFALSKETPETSTATPSCTRKIDIMRPDPLKLVNVDPVARSGNYTFAPEVQNKLEEAAKNMASAAQKVGARLLERLRHRTYRAFSIGQKED